MYAVTTTKTRAADGSNERSPIKNIFPLAGLLIDARQQQISPYPASAVSACRGVVQTQSGRGGRGDSLSAIIQLVNALTKKVFWFSFVQAEACFLCVHARLTDERGLV